jgi:phage portal protein BeeE
MSSMKKSSIWTFGQQVISNMFKPKKYGASYFYAANYNAFNDLDYLRAYLEIPDANIVVSTKARMFGNGVIKEVNDNGEEVPSRLVDLLRNPNWFQGGKEFMRQTKLFREIFGNEYVYQLTPEGREIEDAKMRGLFTIPSNWVDIYYEEDKPFFTFTDTPEGVKYVVTYNGKKFPLPNTDVIHMNDDRVDIKDTSVKTDGNSMLKGESKFKPLTPVLNNLRADYDARGGLITDRGAMGILSNATSDKVGAIPLEDAEKQRIQDEYSSGYGLMRGQRKLIISTADLRWQQMAISPDKLGLYQEATVGFNKIVDGFGMKADLFTREKGATYENQNEARKATYVDAIIPEANEWIGGFNRKYRNGSKTKLIVDYTHLEVFQEDLKNRGEAMSSTINALSKALQDQVLTPEAYKGELIKLGITIKTK